MVAGSAKLSPVLVLGVPLLRNGRLYNTAVDRLARRECWAWCPKSFLPNYREYYEKRWFAPRRRADRADDRDRRARACRSAPT